MDRVGIFVDAGYLFAQGSAALTGSKRPRSDLVIDAPAAIAALKAVAADRAPECRLLRIYWYDGAIGGARPTTDQALLANSDDVKLRLGFVNSSGQQKGVDSLIVTDLIELARLKSVTDAILLSGDEDVRVGVQIAQNYGVRVHLLGMVPSRGSQSHQLLQEADTTTEWQADTIASFLALREVASLEPSIVAMGLASTSLERVPAGDPASQIEAAVAAFVANLTDIDLEGVLAYWVTERGVPADFDRRLLPICRDALGRQLERLEMRQMRSAFQKAVQAATAAPGPE